MNVKIRKIVFLAMMVSYSLVLYMVEAMLPSISFLAPGTKLGLANVITLALLYRAGFQEALTVLFLRILLSSMFGGGFSSFLYSLTGGVMSLLAMAGAKKLERWQVSILGVSVVGALFFNIGQLTMAAWIIHNPQIFFYFPLMAYVSVGSGIGIGFLAELLLEQLDRSKIYGSSNKPKS